MLADPTLFVRTTFVPPSYLDRYMEAGVDGFKFSDRVGDTPTMVRTVNAYGARDCETDLIDLVYKRGAKLKAGLQGVFSPEFVAGVSVPRFSLDPRRFFEERFIERQPTMPKAEQQALARTILTVHDPAHVKRYLAFLEAVMEKIDWRTSVPAEELPQFEALQEMIA